VILYTWTAVASGGCGHGGSTGITDDSDRARRAAESCLRSGQARLAFVESVRPVMAAHSLNPSYLRTGAGWWATPAVAGDVRWVHYSDPDTAGGLQALAKSAATNR
jgi:hypothetical protein